MNRHVKEPQDEMPGRRDLTDREGEIFDRLANGSPLNSEEKRIYDAMIARIYSDPRPFVTLDAAMSHISKTLESLNIKES